MHIDTPDEPQLELEPAAPALANYTGYLLRRAYARAQGCAQQVLPPRTHPGEGAIIANLAAGGPASQQDLSERLRVNRTIMVKLVDKLEAAGLVQRERNPRDRRSYALVVTARGHEALQAWGQAADRGEAMLTAALDPDERQRLKHLLRRLLPDLEAVAPRSLTELTGFLLTHAHYRLRERGNQALAPFGIEPRQFAALAALEDGGPSPQQRLARQLGVGGPVVVEIVDELERAGLVERHRNPNDRREYALRVTATGQERLRQARQAADAVQAEVTAQLGEGGDRELRALLRKLLTAPAIPRSRGRQDPETASGGGPPRR